MLGDYFEFILKYVVDKVLKLVCNIHIPSYYLLRLKAENFRIEITKLRLATLHCFENLQGYKNFQVVTIQS
jgi:hypothetical protein